MRLVVVESPYAGDVALNMRYLRACLRDCISRGESPYASHGLLTQEGVLDDSKPEERAKGIAAGHAWWVGADAIVFYVDRGWSKGMRASKARYEQSRDMMLSLEIAMEERTLGGDWGTISDPPSREPEFLPAHLLHVIREAYGWLAGTNPQCDQKYPVASRIARAEGVLAELVAGPQAVAALWGDLASERVQRWAWAMLRVGRADALHEVRSALVQALDASRAQYKEGPWLGYYEAKQTIDSIKKLPGFERPPCDCLASDLPDDIRKDPDLHHPDCPWRIPEGAL
jgi:hypothetical protein